ncbi:Sec63 Brl domain-containing protein [Radiomyces spectabilis]|uniref:Sec63 Brl domain-containing protein n=1 Tax=Radiomyces spectabilis TaxID=64574 RepID=UPI00221F7BB7|nr:Sec63 Brl domain-containing protein [Radiomyces spectabilis]KAI8394289.1 Sec63 Brl domain-containing protein [Radiomyces spectabilis]
MAQYTYDEQGFNFYYFLLSVLSLCLVPVTLHSVYRLYSCTKHSTKTNLCHCEVCEKERTKAQKVKPNRVKAQLTKPKTLFIIIGWVTVALLAYQVSHAEAPKASWDPYEILGISEGASLAEIKKVYKKLSLIYHPDKAQPGSEKENEEQFIQISKAYQVLTDEDVRKNYEQYGHPDGKQSFSMGVALPKGLVEGSNSKFVLAFYALIFGIGLPYYIASWWYNSRRQTKDKILNQTMAGFVKNLKEDAGFKDLVKILVGAQEFKENADVRSSEDKLLKEIDGLIAEAMENRFGEKYERMDKTVPAYRRKARTLLYAYLLRLDLTAKVTASHNVAILQDQRFIVEKSIHLLQGLLQIATVKQWLGVAMDIMDLQQHLMQAIFPGEASIKELPHITAIMLRRYFRSKKKHIHSVQQLLQMSEVERKTLLKPLTDSQYLDVMEVANRVPKLSVQKAAFKVMGDKIVTTGAIITFILKLKNGHVVGIEPEAKAVVEEKQTQEQLDKEEEEDEFEPENEPEASLPFAHTPYYPGEKKPYWWIFLGDPKVNRILVPPRKVTDIVDEQTIRIPFAGPPKPGTYTFSLFVKSDTYAGTDILQDIKLTIQDPSELPPEEEVDDTISEPEDDSIAGQMKLMREQGLASALAGGQKDTKEGSKDDDDSSDDSSDED